LEEQIRRIKVSVQGRWKRKCEYRFSAHIFGKSGLIYVTQWSARIHKWPISADLPTQKSATQQFVVLLQCCQRQHNCCGLLYWHLWASVYVSSRNG